MLHKEKSLEKRIETLRGRAPRGIFVNGEAVSNYSLLDRRELVKVENRIRGYNPKRYSNNDLEWGKNGEMPKRYGTHEEYLKKKYEFEKNHMD